MTKRELFVKNNMLSTEFNLYLLKHPKIAGEIPRGAIVVLLPEDDPELAEYNLKIAKRNREADQPMVLVRLGKLRPPTSRITRFKMEVAV
jgi:uncharacterized protein DUF5647